MPARPASPPRSPRPGTAPACSPSTAAPAGDAPASLAGDLGTAYRSAVIDAPDERATSGFAPSGRPGEHAPHRWLGPRTSTLDVVEGRCTLVTVDDTWRRAARSRSAPPLAVPDLGEAVARDLGIGARGAALVRPDGYVAWRRTETVADPRAALDRALDTALGRMPAAVALAS